MQELDHTLAGLSATGKPADAVGDREYLVGPVDEEGVFIVRTYAAAVTVAKVAKLHGGVGNRYQGLNPPRMQTPSPGSGDQTVGFSRPAGPR